LLNKIPLRKGDKGGFKPPLPLLSKEGTKERPSGLPFLTKNYIGLIIKILTVIL